MLHFLLQSLLSVRRIQDWDEKTSQTIENFTRTLAVFLCHVYSLTEKFPKPLITELPSKSEPKPPAEPQKTPKSETPEQDDQKTEEAKRVEEEEAKSVEKIEESTNTIGAEELKYLNRIHELHISLLVLFESLLDHDGFIKYSRLLFGSAGEVKNSKLKDSYYAQIIKQKPDLQCLNAIGLNIPALSNQQNLITQPSHSQTQIQSLDDLSALTMEMLQIPQSNK